MPRQKNALPILIRYADLLVCRNCGVDVIPSLVCSQGTALAIRLAHHCYPSRPVNTVLWAKGIAITIGIILCCPILPEQRYSVHMGTLQGPVSAAVVRYAVRDNCSGGILVWAGECGRRLSR